MTVQAWKLPNGMYLIPRTAESGTVLGDGMVVVPPGDPLIWDWERYYALYGEKIPDYPADAPFGLPPAPPRLEDSSPAP